VVLLSVGRQALPMHFFFLAVICSGIMESWERTLEKNLAWLSLLFVKTSHKKNDERLRAVLGYLLHLQTIRVRSLNDLKIYD
jgi:hypothetical protein